MNIVIYRGKYQYDVVNLFISNVIYFLQKKQFNVTVIDLEESDHMNQIIEIFSTQNIYCVISFNGIGVDIKQLDNGQYLYDLVNTIFLSIYVDHPSYHMGRLSENIKNYLCCFNDKEHVEYVNELLPNHHEIAFFLPHGGLTNNMGQNNQIKTLEEYKNIKSLNIVFAGTFFGNNIKEWENINVDFPKYILDEVSNLMIFDDYLSIHQAFKIIFEKYKIKFSSVGKVKLVSIYSMVQGYIRNNLRIKLINELLNSGLQITVCGNGWENFAKENKNINYIGALDIEENLELIKKAKILVNVTPTLRNGSHERVFTGMLNNTVLFSDRSRYYDEFFENEKDILYYSFNSLDKDIERLKSILSDDKKLFEISQNAYEIANKYHTWENRVDTMIEMVNLSKFMDM